MNDAVRLLFLYGTLVPGHEPPALTATVGRLRRVGPAEITGRLYDLGDYPGAVVDEARGEPIAGVLFDIPPDADVLGALDAYEGFDAADSAASLFRRVLNVARVPDGRRLACWVYLYNRDPGAAPLVAGGNWLRRTAG